MNRNNNSVDEMILQQDTQNRKSIKELVQYGNHLSIGWLERQIAKYIPIITSNEIVDSSIRIQLWNEYQDEKYGRTIYLNEVFPYDELTPIKDGVYFDNEGLRAIVVQGQLGIGIIVKKTGRTYNEVVQMDSFLICRGDIESSGPRKRLFYDGNYTANIILVDAFPETIPFCLMAAIQYLHRYCTHSVGHSVIHTRGYLMTNEGGQDFRGQQILKDIIRGIVPQTVKVIKNIHPVEMKGLEFDIWIPEYKIALEFQGAQHFKAIKSWGGDEGLKARQKNDRRKKLLAKKNGISLIVISYTDDISQEKISAMLVSANAKMKTILKNPPLLISKNEREDNCWK